MCDDDYIRSGEEHVSLIRRVDHAWCGALVDNGNDKTEEPYTDIASTAPHAVNWQVKRAMGSDRDAPQMDTLKLITIVRKSGYRGKVPIETLPLKQPDYRPFVTVPAILKKVRAVIKTTAAIEAKDQQSGR